MVTFLAELNGMDLWATDIGSLNMWWVILLWWDSHRSVFWLGSQISLNWNMRSTIVPRPYMVISESRYQTACPTFWVPVSHSPTTMMLTYTMTWLWVGLSWAFFPSWISCLFTGTPRSKLQWKQQHMAASSLLPALVLTRLLISD
jgi:hypothetical protein